MIRRLILVWLLLGVLASCGGKSETDKAFEGVESAMTGLQVAAAEERIYGDIVNKGEDLPAATDAYVDVLHEALADGHISREEAIRRLADVASDLDEWCADCAAKLDRERDVLEAG